MREWEEDVNRLIMIDSSKCTGCGLCQMACAIHRNGQCEPSLARIRIWRDEKAGLFVPMTCRQCNDPPCAAACLMNVIGKDEESGITIRNLENCISCRVCQVACPFDACSYNYLRDGIENCDQCGGNPQCVKYCPYGALQYAELADILDMVRDAEAKHRFIP